MSNQATQDILSWIDTLPAKEKIYALDMHEYVTDKGIKPRVNKLTYVTFGYWYKGNRVIYLRENSSRHTPLDIAIPYGLKGNYHDINSFIALCAQEYDKNELIKYIVNNICCCDRGGGKCNAERCGGFWAEFADVKRKLAYCHYDITKWKAPKAKLNYTTEDLHWLKRLVNVKIKQIVQTN